MSADTINLTFVGMTPLLMHAGRLADPLDEIAIELAAITSKRPKTQSDYKRIAELEWGGCLWLHGGKPCIPPEAIEKAFVDGAKTRNKGKVARAALSATQPAMLNYDGPSDVSELRNDLNFRLRAMVRVRDARTIRTRPRFPKWSANVSVSFLPSLLNRAQVIEYFHIAGALGIGDWRPRYGKFILQERALE